MCVLAIAFRADPRWRLVLAGNRDELHARPAAPLARWGDAAGTIAGRDLESGGTWLAVGETGRLAVVTNLSGYPPAPPGAPSRGALVADAVAGAGRFGDPATAAVAEMAAFNLIVADGAGALLLSNRPEVARTRLDAGIHGMSNGPADVPWPKTAQVGALVADWLAAGDADFAPLFAGLRAARPGDRQGSVFVRDPTYGTRCSTVVAIAADGMGTIAERRYDRGGAVMGETRIGFRWPG